MAIVVAARSAIVRANPDASDVDALFVTAALDLDIEARVYQAGLWPEASSLV
jgi:hypothetical protein